MNRNKTLDLLKAYAILLVVLGHSIQFTYQNFDYNYLYKFIYSFHMPLFFFISGYVSYITNVKDKLSYKFILNKFNYLIVPYIIFLLIDFILGKKIDINTILFNIDIGYWFFPVLFLIYLSFYLFYIIYNYSKIFGMLFVFTIVILPLTKFLAIYLFKWYFIFFLLGYFLNNKTLQISQNKIIAFFNLGLFIILLSLWQRTGIDVIYVYSIKLITAFSGILLSFNIMEVLKRFNNPSIQYIGINTFGIYVLHFYSFYLINININLELLVLIKFIFALLFSFLFIYIIRKSKYLLFLIGGK